MYIILMNKDKSLTTSKRVDLYEGDNLADKIRFLFPEVYNGINLDECVVRLNYRDVIGEERSEILVKDTELYKNRLSYRYPIDSKFTEFYGDILFNISFSVTDDTDGDGTTENVLFHTESHVIAIKPRPDSIAPEEILPENSTGKILKEIYDLEEQVKELENEIFNLTPEAVQYVKQELTEEQKEQARENIGTLPSPITATVGQHLIVKSIDENGKAKELEAKTIDKDNYIVTINVLSGKSDKSSSDIIDAYLQGKIITGITDGRNPLLFLNIDERQSCVYFKGFIWNNDNESYRIYQIRNYNVTYEDYSLETDSHTVIGAINEVNKKASMQSDLNQNDETASDYIKNRTHYTYKSKVADEVLFDDDIQCYTYQNLAQYRFPSHLVLNKETEYLLQFDNTDVIVKCDSLSYALEGDALSNIGSSIQLYDNSISIWNYVFKTFHLKISTVKDAEIVVPIDDKFIPDTIQRVSDTNKALENVVFMENDGVIIFSEGGNFVIDDDSNGNVTITSSKIEAKESNGNINIKSSVLSVIDDGVGNITIIEQ